MAKKKKKLLLTQLLKLLFGKKKVGKYNCCAALANSIKFIKWAKVLFSYLHIFYPPLQTV